MIALHTDTFPGLSVQKIPLKDLNYDLSYTLILIHFTLILILFQFFDFAKKRLFGHYVINNISPILEFLEQKGSFCIIMQHKVCVTM